MLRLAGGESQDEEPDSEETAVLVPLVADAKERGKAKPGERESGPPTTTTPAPAASPASDGKEVEPRYGEWIGEEFQASCESMNSFGRRAGGSSGAGRKRSRLRTCLRRTWIVLFVCSLLIFFVAEWIVARPPPVFVRPAIPQFCPSGTARTGIEYAPYVVREDAVCSSACGTQCFPRVRGLCISHDRVSICEGGGSTLPPVLRFAGKNQFWRRNVKIRRGSKKSCKDLYSRTPAREQDGTTWIRGTQMVGDMKMMPNGPHSFPSPHHEAEKLIPALLISRFYGLNGSAFYWFTDPIPNRVTTIWTRGLIKVFADQLDVKLTKVPEPGSPPVCFEDAVLFSAQSNAGYIPNSDANDWLRDRVLNFCHIRKRDANNPAQDVVLLDRQSKSRKIENMDEVQMVLERVLGRPVKRGMSGLGDFCEQVRLVAEGDVFVTPHGSQNVNFLFARPGATVMEAFPLLYYLDWFRNYVHSAKLNYHELMGTWPAERMPLRYALYALLVGWKDCFNVRQCMNYAKNQQVYVNLLQLENLFS